MSCLNLKFSPTTVSRDRLLAKREFRQRRDANVAKTGRDQAGLSSYLQSSGVHDVGGSASDEVDDVVKGCTKIHLIAVLLHVANMGRANAVFQPQ